MNQRRLTALLAVLSIMLLGALAPCAAWAGLPANYIEGHVSDEMSPGTGIPGVLVEVYDHASESLVATGVTNALGDYLVPVAEGQYHVHFDTTLINSLSPDLWYEQRWYSNATSTLDPNLMTIVIDTGLPTRVADQILLPYGTFDGVVQHWDQKADAYVPVEGIVVSIHDESGAEVTSTVTGADGGYQTGRLAPSQRYDIAFDTADFNATHTAGPHLVAYEFFAVPVYWPSSTVNIELPSLTLNGFTYHPYGYGIPGVTVELWDETGMVCSSAPSIDGYYSFAPPAGTFKVRFNPADYNAMNPTDPLAISWYPSAATSQSATTIQIGEGLMDIGYTSQVDAQMHYMRTHLRLWDNWQSFEDAVVTWYDADTGSEIASGSPDPSGYAYLGAPTPGDYQAYVDFSGMNAALDTMYRSGWLTGDGRLSPDRSIAASLPVRFDDDTEFYVTLEENVRFRGGVVGPLYEGLEGVGIEAWHDGSLVATTASDAGGSFRFELEPGVAYAFYFDTSGLNAGDGPDLKRGWWNEWQGLVPYQARSTWNRTSGYTEWVDVRLPYSWGVTGRVTDATGVGIGGVDVRGSLTPSDTAPPEIVEFLSGLTPFAITDPAGRYVIDMDYTLAAAGWDPWWEPFTPEWIDSMRVAFVPPGLYKGEYFDDKTALNADPLTMALGVDTIANAELASAGGITGHVTGLVEGTPAPLQLVDVTAYDETGTAVATTVTDSNGAYALGPLDGGTYRLRFDAANHNMNYDHRFAAEWYDDAPSVATATPITLATEEIRSGIDAVLAEKIGTVTGHAYYPSGSPGEDPMPAAWASVSLLARGSVWDSGLGAFVEGLVQVDETQTDEMGAYTFSRVAAGDAWVRFAAPPGREDLVGEYYDNAHTESAATTITVVEDQTTSGIDATYDLAGVIAGTVRDEVTSEGVSGVPVYAMRQSDEGWHYVAYTSTSGEGTYRLPINTPGSVLVAFGENALAPGSTFRASSGGYYASEVFDDVSLPESGTALSVDVGGETTADATLTPCASVAGFISYNPSLGRVAVEALHEVNGEWTVAASGVQEEELILDPGNPDFFTSVPTGNYRIDGLAPGTYKIRFARASGIYATSYYENAPGLESATPLAVAAGENLSSINQTLTVGGRIRGRVLTTDNVTRPPSVCLYRASFSGWHYEPRDIDIAESGDFLVEGLAPGTYALVAGAAGFVPEAWDSRYAADWSLGDPSHSLPPEDATRIVIAPGGSSVTLTTIELVEEVSADTAPPTSRLDIPSGWVREDVIPTLSALDSAGSPYTTYGAVGSSPMVATSILPTVGAEGLTPVSFFAEDAFGNREDTRTAFVRIDRTPPVTRDDAVESYRNRAIVQLFASDRYSGPDETHYVLDDGDEMVGNAVITTEPGLHHVEYWSIDRAGNVESAHALDFWVGDDTTAPSTVASASVGWSKAPVPVSFTATDFPAGVDAIFYSLDGTTPKRPYYNTPVLVRGHGEYTISYRAIDLFGNVEDTHYVTVLSDAEAPVTTASLTRVVGHASVELTATDAGIGTVADTAWRLDGGSVEHTTSVSDIGPGSHTLLYRSTDGVGNEEAWRTLTFDVAHETSIAASASTSTVSYPTTVTLTATLLDDLGQPVTGKDLSVEYSYNATSWHDLGSAVASGTAHLYSTTPTRTAYYRFVFAPEGGDSLYANAASAPIAVSVSATMTTPSISSTIRRSVTFRVSTLLRPLHATGTSIVVFKFQRWESTKWVTRKTLKAVNSVYDATTSKVLGSTRLTLSGKWRVAAYHPAGDGHAELWTAWKRFSVK